MAKATLLRPAAIQPPPEGVTLELSMLEAAFLLKLTGGSVIGDGLRSVSDTVYTALADAMGYDIAESVSRFEFENSRYLCLTCNDLDALRATIAP